MGEMSIKEIEDLATWAETLSQDTPADMGFQVAASDLGRFASALRQLLDAQKLRPMESAPRDRETIIWAKFKDDMEPYNKKIDDPYWHVARQGRWAPVRHEGYLEDGYDLGWSVALPVGYGGLPSEWFDGWLPLPPLKEQGEQGDG